MIEISSISGGYRDRKVFTSFSAVLRREAFTAVLGPNGSGKSTLLRFLVRELKPSSGSISVDGVSVDTLSQRELARLVAFVPQSTSGFLSLTVSELVSLSRYTHSGTAASLSRSDVQAVEKALELTDTAVFRDRPVCRLSGGERQRVLIARALAQDTPYILLDEPVSSLDPKHELEILTILSDAVKNEGKGIVCVLHSLNAALAFADEALLLKNGQNEGSGPASEIFTAPVLSRVYDTPVSIETLPDGSRLARVCSVR